MRRSQSAIALLLVAIVLLIDAMVACPALHKALHPDADKPGHHCAVTVFAHGHVGTTSVEVEVVFAVLTVPVVHRFYFAAFTPAIEHLPAGRAPPAFSVVA